MRNNLTVDMDDETDNVCSLCGSWVVNPVRMNAKVNLIFFVLKAANLH